jgi:hypothetical protein
VRLPTRCVDLFVNKTLNPCTDTYGNQQHYRESPYNPHAESGF